MQICELACTIEVYTTEMEGAAILDLIVAEQFSVCNNYINYNNYNSI